MNDNSFERSMKERGIEPKTVDPSKMLSIKNETSERGEDMKEEIKKIKIVMLETINGRDDDEVRTKQFIKDEEYNVGPELAHVFIKQMKIAKEVTGKAVKVPENKAIIPDENKGAEKVPGGADVKMEESPESTEPAEVPEKKEKKTRKRKNKK